MNSHFGPRSLGQRLNGRLRRSRAANLARRAKSRFFPGELPLLMVMNGGGGEWPAMGRELYRAEPVFRESIARCSAVVVEVLSFEIVSAWSSTKAREDSSDEGVAARLEKQKRAMVELAALQIAQCDLWRAQGIVPDGVIGLSQGEAIAAYVAGALSLEEAMRVSCAIADATLEPTLSGQMIFLDADSQSAAQLQLGAPVRLDVLGVFSSSSTLFWVTEEDYPLAKSYLDEAGAKHIARPQPWTYHLSRRPFDRAKFERHLAPLQPRPPAIPWYCSLSASRITPETPLDSLFWYGLLTRPCRFHDAFQSALGDGYGTLLSIGARPFPSQWMEQNLQATGRAFCVLASMRNDKPELQTWNHAQRTLRARGFGSGAPKTTRISGASTPSQLVAPDVQLVRDPHPLYATLRAQAPLHFFPDEGFALVLGYDEVVSVLRRADQFSSSPARDQAPVLVGADPPEHIRGRAVTVRWFSARRVQSFAPLVDSLARELLQPIQPNAEFDVVREFAAPLVEQSLTHVLGLDEAAATQLRRETHPFKRDVTKLFEASRGFFRSYVDEMRRNPRPDFCSLLLAPTGEEALSTDDIVSLLTVLWVAGTETTPTLIAEALLLLSANPDVRAQVQANRELLPALVEEALRLSSPAHNVLRCATQTVTVSGTTIPAGTLVRVCIAAANRDPARFPNPDQIDLTRDASSVVFGRGIHRCVGLLLARTQARIALEAMFDTFPEFRLAEPPCAVHRPKSLLATRTLEDLRIGTR